MSTPPNPTEPPHESDNGRATRQLERGGLMIGPAVVHDATVHLVVDLALRIGELQLASGAGAADVTATILAVAEAYGLPQCEVDVILTSITVCCRRGVDTPPVTTTRVVRFRSLDYTRLSLVDRLVMQIVRQRVSAVEAYQELDRLVSAAHSYPRWVATAGWAAMAASVAVLLGQDLWVALIAAGVTALVDRVGRVLNRKKLPFFFQQVVGAGLIATVSVGIYASGLFPPHLSPALVLAASLTVLLAGLSVVGTMQDAITGFYVTAAGRAFEVVLMTAGLIAGVVLALQAGTDLGVDLTPPASPTPQLENLPVQASAAAMTATFFALACYAPPRALLGAAVGGAISFTVFILVSTVGVGVTGAAGLAAICVGFLGRLVSRRLGLPPLVMAVSGITPLLPGMATYQGLLELSVMTDPSGLITLLAAASIGLALGAGVVLGEFLAQPLRTRLGRLEQKLAGPRLVGPLRWTRRQLD